MYSERRQHSRDADYKLLLETLAEASPLCPEHHLTPSPMTRSLPLTRRGKTDQPSNTIVWLEQSELVTESVAFRPGYWQYVIINQMDAASLGLAIRDCKERGFAPLTYAPDLGNRMHFQDVKLLF